MLLKSILAVCAGAAAGIFGLLVGLDGLTSTYAAIIETVATLDMDHWGVVLLMPLCLLLAMVRAGRSVQRSFV